MYLMCLYILKFERKKAYCCIKAFEENLPIEGLVQNYYNYLILYKKLQ